MTCHSCAHSGKCGILGNPDTCQYYEEKEKEQCILNAQNAVLKCREGLHMDRGEYSMNAPNAE